jgi:zinc transport system substrate-binding protein
MPDPDRINIFVSIAPQKYFVERIGGDHVSVSVLVKPGQSPATYEPTSNQMLELSKTDMYIRIGVPFERNWLKRIRKTNLRMKILNSGQGIDRRAADGGLSDSGKTGESSRHRHAMRDPHIWLNPDNVKIIAENIYKTLSSEEPSSASYFKENLEKFHADLDTLDTAIKETLAGISKRTFLVFHPSWGYFADAYGLKQMPVEVGGKEASTRELVQVIEAAKREKVKAIFVQEQFSRKQAESIAHEIDAVVIALDPLAEDYENNLLEVARTLAKVMK